MALYGFNRRDARTLRRVAKAFEGRSPNKQTLTYAEVMGLLGGNGKKQLVRFTLDNALTTSEASESATITNQYGPGVAADTATTITVHNLADNTGSAYIFEGDSGDAGLAMWDTGTNYRIIQMECP